LQKAANGTMKDGLSAAERRPFAGQETAFCKAAGMPLANHLALNYLRGGKPNSQ
jgi:hypothetical protein